MPPHDHQESTVVGKRTPSGLSVTPSSLPITTSLCTPTLHDLTLAQNELSSRSTAVRDRLNDANLLSLLKPGVDIRVDNLEDGNSSSFVPRLSALPTRNVFLLASDTALRLAYRIMEEEALHLLSDLHAATPGRRVTPWHAKLAQKRAHAYLDAVELAIDQATHCSDGNVASASLMKRIGSKLDCVASHKETNICITNSNHPRDQTSGAVADTATRDDWVSVSCWTLPMLAFDVVVGGPCVFDSQWGRAQNATAPRTNSGLHVPIKVEVRAMVQVFAREDGNRNVNSVMGSCGSRDRCRPCFVEILRCSHKEVNVSTSSIVGDVALLLLLRPLEDSKIASDDRADSLKVLQARMFQTNALPPRPHASVDLYTSSAHGNEEVTIALRFQTRRSQNREPPELRVDIVVES